MPSTETKSSPPPPPQWVLDLNSEPAPKPKASSVPNPPGYIAATTGSGKRSNASSKQNQVPARKPPTPEEMDTLKLKKAWELAIAPAKQLPMNAVGMWMTGNSLQIFSIFMVFQLFKGPLTSIMNIQSTFIRLESDDTKSQMLLVKLVYILTNLLALGLGIYKVNKMGLLPTTRSDWLAWETQRMPLETAYPDHDNWI